MIEWLQNYCGIKSINSERAELEFLRKEIKKHNKDYKSETFGATTEDFSSQSENEEDEEEIAKFEEELKYKKVKNVGKGQRASVSAEVYGRYNLKKEFIPKVIPKSKEQKQRITETIEKSILMSSLTSKELDTVINAFEEKRFKYNDLVIKQGDQGDVLYLIESGCYECYKQFVRLFYFRKKMKSQYWLKNIILVIFLVS